MNKRSVDLTEAFTKEGVEKLKQKVKKEKNLVLTFNKDGKDHHYKVKITKGGTVLGKEITMGVPEGLMIVEDVKEKK